MRAFTTIGGLLAGLLAGPALAVTLVTPPVLLPDGIRLRCNITNTTSSLREGTVCTVPLWSPGTYEFCEQVQLQPHSAYASPGMAGDGAIAFCRFQMGGTSSSYVAAGLVTTSPGNVPLAVLPTN